MEILFWLAAYLMGGMICGSIWYAVVADHKNHLIGIMVFYPIILLFGTIYLTITMMENIMAYCGERLKR